MSILDPSYMIDLGGIDVIQSQGVAIPGLYQKLLDNIGPCGNPLIYNWKFNGVFIPPQFVEPILENDAIYINDIYVSSNDVVHIPSIEIQPTIVQLNVSENGEYEAPEGVDGYDPVIVDVSTYFNWRDPLSINWDFSNPVNTRGSTSYSSSGLIYTLDGWQLQAGSLAFDAGGIRLTRYAAGTAGFFMQRFKRDMTTAFSGQTLTLSALIDGVLYSATETVISGSGNKIELDAGGLSVRLYNYGTEAAITFDIDVGTESRLIQAVKFEAGSSSTLATQVGGVWVLNNTMDATTEFIRARDGTVYNS